MAGPEAVMGFLAALSRICGGATTPLALGQRASEVLGRLPWFRCIELAWVDRSSRRANVVTVDGSGCRGSERALSQAAREVLRLGKTGVSGTEMWGPETEIAQEAGATAIAWLPLQDDRGPACLATVGLAGELDEMWGTAEFLDLLGMILFAGMRSCRWIGRVASLSRQAQREVVLLQQRVADDDSIVARSAVMQAVLEQADRVAVHDTTVLLTGESGTGKELLARRIHRNSLRKGPFLQVNCGALPEHLIESDLFGHEKGAFTGADRQHVGRFERADTGTLLLDEVGDLPLAAQVKLLRVLEEGRVERVGGESMIVADVRVIAATHRSLDDMVESGQFREDLYYRLNVFPIRVPALRDRPEDIPALTEVLLRRIAHRLGRPVPRLTPAIIEQLMAGGWRGNVRELSNVLERAMIQSEHGGLVLPPRSVSPPDDASGQTLDGAIRCVIESALCASGGRVFGDRGAAARLAMNPRTLQSKLRKLEIDVERFKQE